MPVRFRPGVRGFPKSVKGDLKTTTARNEIVDKETQPKRTGPIPGNLICFVMAKMKEIPDTATFHFSNVNPKGRKTGDCVIRAIAAFLGEPWDKIYRDLAELGIKRGTAMDCPETYVKYLEARGFAKCAMPRHANGTRYTGREYCERLAVGGWCYIVSMAGHLTFINTDGRIWDIWDCGEKSVGNVWKRQIR